MYHRSWRCQEQKSVISRRDLSLPGQFELLDALAMGVFEELRVGFADALDQHGPSSVDLENQRGQVKEEHLNHGIH
jgi:hypothetical protein